MAEIYSGKFTSTINRPTVNKTGKDTKVIIYNKGNLLTPVNTTPANGQYKVTILKTTNCTARLEDDYKTITLLTATGNSGEIEISIDIEGKKTLNKTIPVAVITSSAIIESHYSEQQQLADKFTWLVKSGTSSSNMKLTDELFELVSKNITLTADNINLNGYVSNDQANWSIDKQGNISSKNMAVEGELSCETLTIDTIANEKYPATLEGTIDIGVSADYGNDEADLADGVWFKTLQTALDKIPRFMNGKTVRITLYSNVNENVKIQHLSSGVLRIYMNGFTLNGAIRAYACSTPIYIYGGNAENSTGTTGIIHPNTGVSFAERTVSVGVEACTYVALYKLKIYASDNLATTNTDKVCVGSQCGTGCVYCDDIEILNTVIGFRTNNQGSMQVAKSSGIASKYAFQAYSGGTIGLHDNLMAGGTIANTNKTAGGQIWYDNPTFPGDTTTPTTESTLAPGASATKILSIKSTVGDTWRSSYNSWRNRGQVCQGNGWGSGNCDGYWFFGSAFAELKGKNITKIQISIKRNQGGNGGAVNLAVKSHNISNKPSGAPKGYVHSCGSLSLGIDSSGTLTITDSKILDALSSGSIKGFGIQSSYTQSRYAVCSGSCTVKITYSD